MFNHVANLIKKDSNKRFVGIIVVKDDDCLLVGERSDNKMIVFPGGHVREKETFFDAAVRECKEESGIEPDLLQELFHTVFEDESGETKHLKVYYTKTYKGKPKETKELKSVKFCKINHLPILEMSNYSRDDLKKMIKRVLGKDGYDEILKNIEKIEENPEESLKKNLHYNALDFTYGDAMNIVGTKLFKFLQKQFEDVTEFDVKDIDIDQNLILKVRKTSDSFYAGNIVSVINSGNKKIENKQLFHFSGLSILEIVVAVLSINNWKMPKGLTKGEVLDMFEGKNLPIILNENVGCDAPAEEYVNKGIKILMEKYKSEQMREITNQIGLIKESLRNDAAVDLRAAETKLMKLFDKLDEAVRESEKKIYETDIDIKNNFDIIENKLLELKNKISELDQKPIRATLKKSAKDPDEILKKEYFYLSAPSLAKNEDSTIDIEFGSDWDITNIRSFLSDIKAKVKKLKREDIEI
jgi:8-oxo-dGTP pyrophosphatase MutT (NUDIX family)